MKNIAIYILVVFITSSCDEYLKIDPPNNLVVKSTMFEDDSQANAAMMGLYISLNQSGNTSYHIPFLTGIYSDELLTFSNNVTSIQHFQNASNPADARTNAFWNNSFNWIYQANAIIEGCSQSKSMSPKLKTQLIAEAKFVRSFIYFYLINFYGDTPFLTSTDYKTNSMAMRNKVNEVYKAIEEDLVDISQDLNDYYVGASGLESSNERLRPNKFTAKALLSKVFLFQGKWQNAVDIASEVIERGDMYNLEPIGSTFLRTSNEAIWQMEKVVANIQGTYEGQYFQINNRPVQSDNNGSILSQSLVSSFEQNDLRFSSWVGIAIDIQNSITYYFPFKLKNRSTSSPLEYSTPIRLSDIILIRSEANAELGNISLALQDLNKIRTKSGLELKDENINKSALIETILEERRHEFFAEWGNRWMDIKRRHLTDSVMPNALKEKGGNSIWYDFRTLWPIPEREILSNPNLIQNIGYN
jgi:hypothetical protein